MIGEYRLADNGSLIDREQVLSFTFDGRRMRCGNYGI